MTTCTPEQQECREIARASRARIESWWLAQDVFDRPSDKLPAIRAAYAALTAAVMAGDVAACQRACDALEQAYQAAMLAQAGL